jgi:hypothetical protein
LWKAKAYALQANGTRWTGEPHPEPETQLADSEPQKPAYRQAGWPMISVETQQKEGMGHFKNPGRGWGPKAAEVNAPAFEPDALGQALP